MRRGRLESATAEFGCWLRWRGRTYRTLVDIREYKPGHYRVVGTKFHGEPSEVYGGRKAGVRADEWYLEMPESTSPVKCLSMADALRLLDEA